MVWYFIGVYIINRTLHGHLEIQNFSLSVEKIIFQHLKRNFVSPRGHVISSISGEWHNGFPNTFMLDSDLSGGCGLPMFGPETDRTIIFRLYQQIQML